MTFAVVCISRTLAAGGEVIGQAVAQRLGFQYVDEQIISRAAEQAQVDPKLVAEVEQRHSLLQRILDRLATAGDLVSPVSLATGVPVEAFIPSPLPSRPMSDDLREMIRASIHEIAAKGRVVIVAHAASMALAGQEGVLRVLVTASPDTRAQRVVVAQGGNAADATAAIATSDRSRRDYLQHFYKVREELPTHYDLVVNTDVLTPEQAANTIVSVMQG